MPDSKENQGSYSAYPALPVPPGSQIPTEAAGPTAVNSYLYSNPYHSQYTYGYPIGLELYPSQMQYMAYHQPVMAYSGGYGVPAQGVVPMKKKFYNSVNNYKNETQSNSKSGNVVGTNALNAGGTNSEINKSVQVTIKNLFKFEIGNSNCVHVDSLKVEYPMFINTNSEEYSKAKSKRCNIRLESLRDIGPICSVMNDGEHNVKDLAATNVTVPSVLEKSAEVSLSKNEVEGSKSNDEIPTSNSGKQHQTLNSSKKDIHLVKEHQEASTKREELSWTEYKPEKKGDVLAKPLKSWSQVALSAMNKVKTPGEQSQTFFKMDRKSISPSIKRFESVGSVTLKLCLDKDYANFVNEGISDSAKAVNVIAPRGILNKGNICFMSSVLQVLLFCKPFIKMLNVIYARTGTKASSSLPSLLGACISFYKEFDKNTFEKEKSEKQVSNNISESNKTASQISLSESIDPEPFYNSISKLGMFRDLKWGHQEDAEEFLTHFLDQLHEEFVSTVNCLDSKEILAIYQSIPVENIRIELIKSLSKFKRSDFIKNTSSALKALIEKHKNSMELDCQQFGTESSAEWQEVSKKGKKIKNAVRRTTEVEFSPVMTIFGGEYRSVLDIPQHKESQSITLDPFYTLHLHISDPEVKDLESAFKKFSDFEYLPYKADSGNDVKAKKQTFIDKLPHVLLIQLKRFEFVNNSSEKKELANYNAYNGRIEKIRKLIKYSHELIIPKEAISVNSKFYSANKDTKYRLTGVVYHHGLSPSGGHYTSDVLHQDQDKWYRIDDNNVMEINKDDVVKGVDEGSDSKTAYILLYQKR